MGDTTLPRVWISIFRGEGAAPPLPALRGTVGASCWPPAYMLWRESSGIGSGIINLLYDGCSSPRRRRAGRSLRAGGEGADLARWALTRVAGCGEGATWPFAVCWTGYACQLARAARRWMRLRMLMVCTMLTT